jgi:ABC-type lipoprotein export system ATPase subunit
MNVFPWIFAEIKDTKRVYLKFVKYLIKGKMLKLNLEKNKTKETMLTKEEESLIKSENNKILNSNLYSEKILLKISDVKIKYNVNANIINNSIDANNNKNNEILQNTESINKSFDLTIDKSSEFCIEKGEIVIIYGSNASGKSLLLKAILDYCIDESEITHDHKHSETLIIPFCQSGSEKFSSKINLGSNKNKLKSSNSIYVKNNNISYVPQELWTFSASVFENITFNNKIKNPNDKNNLNNLGFYKKEENEIAIKKRFEEILKKCEMLRDIETFPEKELKIINFKGSNISGGQKQRINIARAAFNKDCDLLLFDNCLSSIDSNIGNLIFNNLFQDLKNQGKAIVFVTSDRKWLKNADKIYFIEKNKLVKKEQTELKGFYDSSISVNYYLQENTFKKENKGEQTNLELAENINNKKINNGFDKENSKEDKNNNIHNSLISIVNNNEITTGNVSISNKTLVFFFSKAGYLMFITTVLFLTFMQLGKNFIELFLADWLKNDKTDFDKKVNLQRRNMGYYLLFVVLHTLATIGRSAFFAINFLNASEKIYKMTIEKFIFSKIKCLQKFNIGYLTNL